MTDANRQREPDARQPQSWRRRYRFVDCAAAKAPGFRNHLLPVEQVGEFVSRFGPDECFATIFFFSEEALLYLAEHRVDGHPSIAGFDGKVWASFLPIDVDAEASLAGLGEALRLTQHTYAFLRKSWQIPDTAMHVYFSGHKGFHLLVDTRVFGRVAPATDLHRVFSLFRLRLWQALRAPATAARFDLAIGDKVRLLRLANTRHNRSELYKIPLSPEELFTLSPPDIVQLARAPRALSRTQCQGLLPLEPVHSVVSAQQVFAQARRMVRRGRVHPYRFPAPPADVETALCPARQLMLEQDIPEGFRNNVAIRLASALRRAGYSELHTRNILRAWNQRLTRPLKERELQSVIRSAYARPFPYAYGCHDEVMRRFCPFRDHLLACDLYRQQHPQRHAE
ncbi:MAG: primase C-terminal domain-containing protein [Candidatus Binatia bacterium]|nr:primase C-terminal domain-containing protein [Candidatus Binatia bacterium]